MNFTSGTAPSVPDSCKNATGLQASFTSDAALSATAAATGSPSMSGGPAPSASGSGVKSAATSVGLGALGEWPWMIVVVGIMMLGGIGTHVI